MSDDARVRVKICATTSLGDAEMALAAGAHRLGFVFAPSKRQVTVAQVAPITAALPTDTQTVGVFAHASANEIVDAARAAGLRGAQLHFAYDPAVTREIARLAPAMRIIQVLSIDPDLARKPSELEARLLAILIDPAVSSLLIDSAAGGSGKRFDWKPVSHIVRAVRATSRCELIVAGGLNADNVGEAIQLFSPDIVDVASGVEMRPGEKSRERLSEFIAAVRSTIRPL